MKKVNQEEFEDSFAAGCNFWRADAEPDAVRCGSGRCCYQPKIACGGILRIREWLAGGETVVLFRNQQMNSSGCGRASCMVVGPARTYKTLDSVQKQHLGDLPSQRQYPEVYCEGEPACE